METKLLNLNAYGVEEMSVAEMQETNGGDSGNRNPGVFGLIFFAAIWLVPAIVEIIRNR